MEDYRIKVNRGVNIKSEFVAGKDATIRPLWRPYGDQAVIHRKNPPQLQRVTRDSYAPGVGFEPTTK